MEHQTTIRSESFPFQFSFKANTTIVLIHCIYTFAIAILAGAINSVAGGGTLLTFPVMVLGCGMDRKIANATNTVGLLPAAYMGARGFGDGGKTLARGMEKFYAASFLGGLVGSLLLYYTSSGSFKVIVPWLILMAAVTFLLNDVIVRHIIKKPGATTPSDQPADSFDRPSTKILFFQFLIAIYGGYFGAGIGIMMLAALSLMRAGDIYRMNYLKNLAAFTINGVSSIVFAVLGLVDWPIALSMAAGAVLGGWGGAGIAKKIGPRWARGIVSVVGLLIAVWMIAEQIRAR